MEAWEANEARAANNLVRYELERLRTFLDFLEEKYLPRTVGELQEEFEKWEDEQLLKPHNEQKDSI